MYKAYYDGGTIVIIGVHKCWLPIAQLQHQIELFLGNDVSINFYMTPQQSQGFGAHFDSHDTFILQLEGNKTWRIYDEEGMMELPMEQPQVDPEKLGKPSQQIHLQPGDLLYVPRGIIHDAVTDNCSSLHLTVGLYPLRWIDVLQNLLNCAAETDVTLRRSVPLNQPEHTNHEMLVKMLPQLLRDFSEKDFIRQVFSNYRKKNSWQAVDLFLSINLRTAWKLKLIDWVESVQA